MVALRRFANARAFPILRALVLLLVLPLATAGTLPAWAALVGSDTLHVCHCAADHHDCVCAKCHTDPDAETAPSTATIRGQCGDEEAAIVGAKPFVAVLHASVDELLPVDLPREGLAALPPAMASRDRTRPTTPPPRRAA